eukprot:Rhum_TRINITY_DN25902_c0_g1::Rhum_TRINITY_DN25902_c0_g1_i1::g.182983::m.182983
MPPDGACGGGGGGGAPTRTRGVDLGVERKGRRAVGATLRAQRERARLGGSRSDGPAARRAALARLSEGLASGTLGEQEAMDTVAQLVGGGEDDGDDWDGDDDDGAEEGCAEDDPAGRAQRRLLSLQEAGGVRFLCAAVAHLCGGAAAPPLERRRLWKDAVWALGNVACQAPPALCEDIVAGATPAGLLRCVDASYAPADVRREGLHLVGNLVRGGTLASAQALVEHSPSCLTLLQDSLQTLEAATIETALDALYNVLWWGETLGEGGNGTGQRAENPYLRALEAQGGLDAVEKLQEHRDDGVYEAAVRLVDAANVSRGHVSEVCHLSDGLMSDGEGGRGDGEGDGDGDARGMPFSF